MSLARLLIYTALLVSHLGLLKLSSGERPEVEELELEAGTVPAGSLVSDPAATPAASPVLDTATSPDAAATVPAANMLTAAIVPAAITPAASPVPDTAATVPAASPVPGTAARAATADAVSAGSPGLEGVGSPSPGPEHAGSSVAVKADNDAQFWKNGNFAPHDEDEDPVEIVAIGQQTWHPRTTPELLHLAGLHHELEPEQDAADDAGDEDDLADAEESTPRAKMRGKMREDNPFGDDDEPSTLTPHLVVTEQARGQPDLELLERLNATRRVDEEPQETQVMVKSTKNQLYVVSGQKKKWKVKQSLQ